MIEPSIRAEWEQLGSYLGEVYPYLVRCVYQGFRRQGFTPAQAMDLIKVYFANRLQQDQLWGGMIDMECDEEEEGDE